MSGSKDISKALMIIPVEEGGDASLISMGHHAGKAGDYELFGADDGEGNPTPIVKNSKFSLAVVKHPSGQLGLAKVNSSPEGKSALEKEARILHTLHSISNKIDIEATTKGEQPPNLGAFLPTVAEVIKPSEDKIVLLLGYHPAVKTYKQLVPLSVATDGKRIDLKTATWMLGKGLKTLSFIHALNFSMGNLNSSTVLIEKEEHGVVFFDFSNANEDPTEKEKLAEVSDLAKMIWEAVGGNDESEPPYDKHIMTLEQYDEYCIFLSRVTRGETEGASKEHELMYELDKGLCDRIWPRKEKVEGELTIMKRDFHVFCDYDIT